ncbi:MAG: hypothetical protein FLDDKLPJ_02220 [Phycisphaerae bacterium]|nr:hypothetical protein [Phycisphaerae bacterium]
MWRRLSGILVVAGTTALLSGAAVPSQEVKQGGVAVDGRSPGAQAVPEVRRAAQGVIGGPHDFTLATGRARDACAACHVPHVLGVRPVTHAGGSDADAGKDGETKAASAAQGAAGEDPDVAPVAEAAARRAILEMYRMTGQSPAHEPNRFTPGATSLICLGCHDGTVASSTIGTAHAMLAGVREGFEVPDGFVWRDHPIGVPYPQGERGYVPRSRVEADGRIRLPEGRVECVSCHDPHNAAGEPYLLAMSNRRSALCLACHEK